MKEEVTPGAEAPWLLHRRDFMKGAAWTGAALMGGGIALAQNGGGSAPDPVSGRGIGVAAPAMAEDQVPKKSGGKTGLRLSALGIGGFHLGTATDQNIATQIVNRALDAGVNFFDNAWEYHEGESEIRLGEALKGKREKAIVMTKVCTHGRGKDVAMRMLEESLRRLQTDYLDVWQIHEVIYYNDPDLIFAPGGAAEALLDAKKQGKVRFIGFTGHKDPSIHLRMLSQGFPFDTVQMPLNCFDATFRSFETHVLPEANRQQLAVFGMKSLGGGGEMVTRGAITPEEGLRYALSLPVATTISGIDSMNVLEQNLAVARGFKPLSDSEMATLRDRCRELAGDGHLERFKTTMLYDGDVGREQHGYPSSKEVPL
jgi:aryl-alcohol dehydrogenase-like predicted oxidoreductase